MDKPATRSEASTRVLQVVVASRTGSAQGNSVIGPERRAANLVGRWLSVGIEPIVCYPRRGNLWSHFSERAPTEDFEIGSKFNWSAPVKIVRIARRYGVQLIHTQGPPSLDLLALIASMILKVPLVVTRPVMIYEHVYYARWRLAIYDWIDRAITLAKATRIIAVSRHGFQYLSSRQSGPASRVRLIHNGVSLARFSSRTHSTCTAADGQPTIVITMVAQLIESKGWYDFLRVVEQLKLERMNFKALVVGEGTQRPHLEQWVADRALNDYVNFLGYQSDVAPIYQETDILLFTTHTEGLSVAIIEAMASGLPIVATDVGGIRDQIDEGVNGYIVPAGDVVQMKQRCVELMRNPALRARMGAHSRRAAEIKFDEDRMLAQYGACYQEVAR